MFLLGIVLHIYFLLSMFDIYFKSPIVRDVDHYQPNHEAVADRLVLFVVDGLRAESFVNYTTMPYLRSVANSHGRWGISQTRVPTESRPGHIAMISGFYEDPSAVTKGWSHNTVDFDSVLNQTSCTLYWGTRDIVNIFMKGRDDRIFPISTFDSHNATFSTNKNSTRWDSWVFAKVTEFFVNVTHNSSVSDKLKKNKIVFFIHLMSTDASGHIDKPRSDKFRATLRFVDEGIRDIERVIRNYYGDDGKTTFLMTSDHGMTDWGSHGSGDEHETQTPYVIWGAGVLQVNGHQNNATTKGLSSERRLDIEQADLTPLMATVLSIPVPVNNIGKLVHGVLNMTISNKAKALYSNAKQLVSQYDKKRSDVEANIIPMFLYPFKPFTEDKYRELFQHMEKLLQAEEYEKIILLCNKTVSLSRDGLNYYHNYYQRPLLILVTLSFIGWIVCLMRLLAEQNSKKTEACSMNKYNLIMDFMKHNLAYNVVFAVIIMLSFCFVFVQSLPLAYYVYFLLPVGLWWYALSNIKVYKETFQQLRNRGLFTVFIEIIFYTLGSMALGLSFTHRWMLSVPLLGMAIWPFFSTKRRHLSTINLVTWISTCAALGVFTFIPVVGKKVFIELVIIAGLLQLIPLSIYIWTALLPLLKTKSEPKREIVLSVFLFLLRIVALHNIYVQSKRFEHRTPVSRVCQVIAWVIAGLSLVLPLLHSKRVICRLLAIYSSILNFYLLLSVSHEGLFMVALMCNASIWTYTELRLIRPEMAQERIIEFVFGETDPEHSSKTLTTIERSISSEDFRRAFFFITYLTVAFFGTGNIASLNSFEVRWVTCFLTSYKPYIITTLILLKTFVPFLVVACNLRTVQHFVKAPNGYLNIIVLIYSNLTGIQLLYYVRNDGSWLEIGTSISQYVIVQVITIFIVVINEIARILTEISIFPIKIGSLDLASRFQWYKYLPNLLKN